MRPIDKLIIKEESTKLDVEKWAEFKNIDVIVKKKKILKNINIEFKFGDNIVILGPNGSGKSTLLKLINRSIYPPISNDSSIKLFNKSNINIWEIRSKIGFLFKEMEERVNKGVTAYELITSGFTGIYNSRNSNLLTENEFNIIKNVIIKLNISSFINQDFYSLSAGQKRLSLLGRALVYKPKLLVLDEPFSNLDIKSNYCLFKILKELMTKAINIVYVTHDLDSIIPGTNRVILIKNGEIINDGNPNDIINSQVISNLFDTSIKVIKYKNYWRSIPLLD